MFASKISNLRGQNAGLESSFQKRQIEFIKQTIDSTDDEAELSAIQSYNTYLKDISKQNRPPPVVKEKETKAVVEEEKEEEKEVKPHFEGFTDMSEMKRAYFSDEPELFSQLRKSHPFRFYRASYKYADEYTGRPAFVAKNLIRGFVRNLEMVSAWLMVRFQCMVVDSTNYEYTSYWIVNAREPLSEILGSMYTDFEFIEMTEPEIGLAWTKRPADEDDDRFVGELYLH